MSYVGLPIPVIQFLRRVFNVISSLSISNQYYLLRKNDIEIDQRNLTDVSRLAPLQVLNQTPRPALESDALTRANLLVDNSVGFEALNVTKYSGVFHFIRRWIWPSDVFRRSRNRVLFSTDVIATNSDTWSEECYGDEKDGMRLPPRPPPREGTQERTQTRSIESLSPIQRLLYHPALFEPLRRPRYPIVLCHGLYGFDVRGPSSFPKLQLHYWSNVLRILKKRIGAEVIVTGVPGTGSIESRAERMDRFLQQRARGRAINLVAHSMGGLDCRHLITHCQPEEYAPISLTTISTPHRGSPFMDWCADYIGIGKPRYDNIPSALASEANLSRTSAASTATDASKPPPQSGTQFTLASLPSSFTTLLLSLIDSPAYSNLTTNYLQNVFNPATPNDPRVKYYSIAARSEALSVWHPLWFPKMVLDGVEDRERAQAQQRGGIGDSEKDEWGNDGLVTVRSAKWGEFLGTLDGCDHWEIRGSRGLGGDFIPVPPAGISVSRDGNVNANGSGGWSWRDWGQFVGAWKREEDRRDRAAASRRGKPDPAERRTSADSDRDDVVKASTDRFSAVFDWIVDQIPASVAGKSVVAPPSEKAGKAKPSKFDLERFYIALSRKLYDDGL